MLLNMKQASHLFTGQCFLGAELNFFLLILCFWQLVMVNISPSKSKWLSEAVLTAYKVVCRTPVSRNTAVQACNF